VTPAAEDPLTRPLRVKDLATILHLSTKTVSRRLKDGSLRAVKLNRQSYRVPVSILPPGEQAKYLPPPR
jgi:excisionase family DNA binding protein